MVHAQLYGLVGQTYTAHDEHLRSYGKLVAHGQALKVKVESEKVGLKLSFQKAKIMPSGPIPSWQIKGEKVEAVTDFIFLGSKITVNGDCCHKIKRRLLL